MTAAVSAPDRRRWRGPKFLLAIPSIIWYLLFFAIPIAFVVIYSFGTKDVSRLLPVDLSNLTTKNYADVFDDTFFKVFRATLRIAILATALCVLIGLPVAYFAAFKVSERWRVIILAAIVVPSFTSFLIRTVAWRIPLAPNGTFSKWLTDIGVVGEQGIQLLQRHGMQPRQWQRNHACKCVAQLLRAHQLVSSGKLWQLHIACL